MLPPLLAVAGMSCGMHAAAERFLRDRVESSWSAAGISMALAGGALFGISCSGVQMAIRVFAVMGAALCLAGWAFAHSELALRDLLVSTQSFAGVHAEGVPQVIVCSVRGVHDSVLIIIAAQRTIHLWKTILSTIQNAKLLLASAAPVLAILDQ